MLGHLAVVRGRYAGLDVEELADASPGLLSSRRRLVADRGRSPARRPALGGPGRRGAPPVGGRRAPRITPLWPSSSSRSALGSPLRTPGRRTAGALTFAHCRPCGATATPRPAEVRPGRAG
ncbi:hypothetical protein ACRAWF_33285 [Streptomyces sp. L7]